MMATGRPSLLFLCQNLPYPPDAGAHIRSFHTLRLLSQRFDVTALCFFRSATRHTEEVVDAGLKGIATYVHHAEAFQLPQDNSRIRLVFDHLRSVVTRRGYTRWTYESSPLRQSLKRLGRHPFEVVHLDSLDLVGYAPALSEMPITCAHHNIESSLLAKRAELTGGWRRGYMRMQARLLEREEREWCPRMALNVVVSPADGDWLNTLSPESDILVVPNGVDTKALVPTRENGDRRGLVFVGGHTWFPNRDGMEFFAEAILPLIHAKYPDIDVTWVGRAPESVRDRFIQQGIRMTGYVEDIRPYVYAAACFVVPLRVGGGTRLKILDAWALGKAVVSTSPGCEGLDAEPGDNILVADGPSEFASAVCRVLEDPDLRRRLERGGRATAERTYDWDVVGGPMLERYSEIARAG